MTSVCVRPILFFGFLFNDMGYFFDSIPFLLSTKHDSFKHTVCMFFLASHILRTVSKCVLVCKTCVSELYSASTVAHKL